MEIFGGAIFSVNRERCYSLEINFRYHAHSIVKGVAGVR